MTGDRNDVNGHLISPGDRVKVSWLTDDTFIVTWSHYFVELLCEKTNTVFCLWSEVTRVPFLTITERGNLSKADIDELQSRDLERGAAYYAAARISTRKEWETKLYEREQAEAA